ncbi:MAG: DUF4363 family protein [Clostridia bacterium]|nr:DUF4363 family protein [Clostridia bacterium]
MKNAKTRSIPAAVYFAFIILAFTLAFVCVNTVILSRTISRLEQEAAAAPLNEEAFDKLYDDFLSARVYLSITVDHDDIACVETEFFEIRGALAIGDTDSAAIAKSRLCGALGHLGRLSGFNIDSVI